MVAIIFFRHDRVDDELETSNGQFVGSRRLVIVVVEGPRAPENRSRLLVLFTQAASSAHHAEPLSFFLFFLFFVVVVSSVFSRFLAFTRSLPSFFSRIFSHGKPLTCRPIRVHCSTLRSDTKPLAFRLIYLRSHFSMATKPTTIFDISNIVCKTI